MRRLRTCHWAIIFQDTQTVSVGQEAFTWKIWLGIARAASKPEISTSSIKISGNRIAKYISSIYLLPQLWSYPKNATHCSIKQASRAIFYVACCSANHFCPIKLLNAPTLHSRPSLAAKRLQQAYRYVRTPEMRRPGRYRVWDIPAPGRRGRKFKVEIGSRKDALRLWFCCCRWPALSLASWHRYSLSFINCLRK